MSDGEWHRLHPLTPVLRGGLFLLVVTGIVIANFRERLIAFFFPVLTPGVDIDIDGEGWSGDGDPVDYILENNLILIALGAVLAVLLLLFAGFWLSWRMHTFRITGDDVEVRSGIIFRTHRRAPLDRVQGVNLTRPMIARLLGAAKLEVVGAGMDSNVKLEYLSTRNAEEVRADILQLASGLQLAARPAAAQAEATGRIEAATNIITEGVTGLVLGADEPVDPQSVVRIPAGRAIAAYFVSDTSVWFILAIVGVIVGGVVGTPWALFSLVPMILGFVAYWFRAITRSLRYSIAPTSAGLRTTFGLFTTITETLPPGRIHAIEVRQPLMWRPTKWWVIRVNKLTGRAATDTSSQQFNDVLPVGTVHDVQRVLALMLPHLPAEDWAIIFPHGMWRQDAGDPFTTTPKRARILRLFSWKRNGFVLTPHALYLRRGVLTRRLVILPLARLQSLKISQGPLRRSLAVANVTGHTVLGQVSGSVGAIDAKQAYALWNDAARAAESAGAQDQSHRWSNA